MKKYLLLLIVALTLSCCDDKSEPPKPVAEIDKLPPVTQTGANTVGCLLDGKALLPSGFNSTNCFYQIVNGEYYFLVKASNNKNNDLKVIRMRTEKKQIFEGETYDLYEWIDGNATGEYTHKSDVNYTTHTHTGQLKISKLDPVNYIVSGTFWYDVEDEDGIVHQIRDGRFDMHYTN